MGKIYRVVRSDSDDKVQYLDDAEVVHVPADACYCTIEGRLELVDEDEKDEKK